MNRVRGDVRAGGRVAERAATARVLGERQRYVTALLACLVTVVPWRDRRICCKYRGGEMVSDK